MITVKSEITINPEALQRGAAAKEKQRKRKKRFVDRRRMLHVGSGAAIRLNGSGTTARKLGKTSLGRKTVATFIRLETQAQVDRANLIQDLLFGPVDDSTT